MLSPGTQQLDLLRIIADFQKENGIATVEDVQLVEKTGLDMNFVRTALNELESIGYVQLEKIRTLLGFSYSVDLTSRGKAVVKTLSVVYP